MSQSRWRYLKSKFAPLGVTFDQSEFTHARCLRCATILDNGAFYCDHCLRTTDPEALEHLKAQEYLCLFSKMILLGVLSKEDYLFPNPTPEFEEYIRECLVRNYMLTGISRNIGFKNPDVTNYLRFYLENEACIKMEQGIFGTC